MSREVDPDESWEMRTLCALLILSLNPLSPFPFRLADVRRVLSEEELNVVFVLPREMTLMTQTRSRGLT